MPLEIAHFAVGAALTTVAVTVLAPSVGYPRTIAALGGGWATLPDAHNVSPVFTAQLRQLHYTSPWMDLFWFHRTLDGIEAANTNAFAAAMLAAFIVTTMLAEHLDDRAPSLALPAESAVDHGAAEDEA